MGFAYADSRGLHGLPSFKIKFKKPSFKVPTVKAITKKVTAFASNPKAIVTAIATGGGSLVAAELKAHGITDVSKELTNFASSPLGANVIKTAAAALEAPGAAVGIPPGTFSKVADLAIKDAKEQKQREADQSARRQEAAAIESARVVDIRQRADALAAQLGFTKLPEYHYGYKLPATKVDFASTKGYSQIPPGMQGFGDDASTGWDAYYTADELVSKFSDLPAQIAAQQPAPALGPAVEPYSTPSFPAQQPAVVTGKSALSSMLPMLAIAAVGILVVPSLLKR